MKTKVKHVFAYYLPQYHRIEENDEWWGENFTEWTNVKSAKIYHKRQSILYPGDLGYYNLLNLETIEAQYNLAIENSIDTFCFWHYWFGDNDTLLEKPAELILQSSIDVNFCFAWANHSWWNKSEHKLLKEQRYDFSLEKYFDYLEPFFLDTRYRKINNKPVFFIFKPSDCCILDELISYFNQRSIKCGFDGVYFIFENTNRTDKSLISKCSKFTNSNNVFSNRTVLRKIRDKIYYKLALLKIKIPRFHYYKDCIENLNSSLDKNELPIIFPCWDSTIRHGKGGVCILDSTPELFKKHLEETSSQLPQNIDDRFLLVKSWNEWAEGNLMEPSNLYGDQYLRTFSQIFELDTAKTKD